MKDQLKSLLSSDIQESDPEAFRNAKRLFAACNNMDEIENTGKQGVLSLLRFNPMIGIEKWTEFEPRWEWQRFDEQSYHYGMSGPVYLSFELVPDPRNSREQIIKVSSSVRRKKVK